MIIFLAIYSNIFENIILAVYSGLHILKWLYKLTFKNKTITKGMADNNGKSKKENHLHICILCTWFYALICDWFGGRSAEVQSQSAGFISNIKETILDLLAWRKQLNQSYIVFLCFIFIISFIIWVASKNKRTLALRAFNIIAWGLLIMIYLVLLCSVVSPYYMTKARVIIACTVPFIMLTALMLCFIL